MATRPAMWKRPLANGCARAGCRDQIILATKGAHPPFQDMHAGRLDRASIQSDLAASLEALGVENVDVYYLAPGR